MLQCKQIANYALFGGVKLLIVKAAKKFGDFSAEVDVSIDERGITALSGPSGAGKTTLVNMIAGLVAPDSGFISCGGKVFFDSSARISLPPERRGLGYVFQQHRLFPHMSVRSNLLFAPKFCGRPQLRERFGRVADALGIWRLMERKPDSLSGGESQRAAIGRAILACSSMLLMDEPLSSLDDERKEELMGYIKEIPEKFGIPVIYVTHSKDELSRLADRVITMSGGRVVSERTDTA
jgi:molybdate transport system ATP-binding protein